MMTSDKSEWIVHLSLCVRGALEWPDALLNHMQVTDVRTGEQLAASRVREALSELLAEGWEVLPIGGPCPGFDPKSGCPGHTPQ